MREPAQQRHEVLERVDLEPLHLAGVVPAAEFGSGGMALDLLERVDLAGCHRAALRVEAAHGSLAQRGEVAGLDRAQVPLGLDVPPDRRGVRESIVGRMARNGGTAEIVTAPGAGTQVRLRLPVVSA